MKSATLKPLDKLLLQLAAGFLSEMADDYLNHGCNDVSLKQYISIPVNRDLFRAAFSEWMDDGEIIEDNVEDYQVIRFVSEKIRDMAEKVNQ